MSRHQWENRNLWLTRRGYVPPDSSGTASDVDDEVGEQPTAPKSTEEQLKKARDDMMERWDQTRRDIIDFQIHSHPTPAQYLYMERLLDFINGLNFASDNPRELQSNLAVLEAHIKELSSHYRISNIAGALSLLKFALVFLNTRKHDYEHLQALRKAIDMELMAVRRKIGSARLLLLAAAHTNFRPSAPPENQQYLQALRDALDGLDYDARQSIALLEEHISTSERYGFLDLPKALADLKSAITEFRISSPTRH